MSRTVAGIAAGLLGIAILGVAFLPADIFNAGLLAFSYDHNVEHFGAIVAMTRTFLVVVGLVSLSVSAPPMRRVWSNTLLPAAPQASQPAYWPFVNDRAAGIAMILCLGLMSVPTIIALITRSLPLQVMLLAEDHLFEDGEAICYLAGALAMGYALVLAAKYIKPIGLVHLVWLGLGLAVLWVGLEEISYGQRIIHFTTPTDWSTVNAQHEFNLHNVATGLINRLFSLIAVTLGVFLPVLMLFSSRVRYLFQRLRVELPKGAVMLPFAMATLWTTPKQISQVDEQQILRWAVIGLIASLMLWSLARPTLRRAAPPLLLFLAVMVATVTLTTIYKQNWLGKAYSEEMKEWFISFGFFCYTLALMRSARRARAAAKRDGVNQSIS